MTRAATISALLCILCASAFSALLTPKQSSFPKSQSMAIEIPPQKHFIVLVWRSDYAGMTNVETEIDSVTGNVIGVYHQKIRVPASQQIVTDFTANASEFYQTSSVFIGTTNRP